MTDDHLEELAVAFGHRAAALEPTATSDRGNGSSSKMSSHRPSSVFDSSSSPNSRNSAALGWRGFPVPFFQQADQRFAGLRFFADNVRRTGLHQARLVRLEVATDDDLAVRVDAMDQANDSKADRVVRNTDDGESCPLDVTPLERFLVRCVTRDGVKTLLFERLQVERAAVDHAYFMAGRFQVRCNATAEGSNADDKRVTRRQ